MRYFARIELQEDTQKWIVMEIIDFNPLGNFHPSLTWVECTSEVRQEWTYDPVHCTFTSPDELQSVSMPLTQEAKIALLTTENVTLTAQISALSNQNDFLEDCIAEMAAEIYK